MTPPGPRGAGARGRVLVAARETPQRLRLVRQLARQGNLVETADATALDPDRLDAGRFDLLLLETLDRDDEGTWSLRALRRDERTRDLPIVALAASGEDDLVSHCLELGADDVLTLPVGAAVLQARVRGSLEVKRRRDRERRDAEVLEREVEVAQRIQRGFLPTVLPQPEGLEVAAIFSPARQCAGDFYDAFPMPDGRLAVVVADVCDKGLGASLFMALFRSLLRATIEWGVRGVDHGEILVRAARRTSDYVARTHGDSNIFATVFLAAIEPATGRLAYVNAGHEPPAIVAASGVRARLERTAPAVGLVEGIDFGSGEERLAPGEVLFAYTDGLTEAKGTAGDFLGEQALLELIAAPRASAAELIAFVEAGVAEHVAGAANHDDLTALAVRRRR